MNFMYLKTAIRQLLRNRVFTLVNTIGLTLAFACGIVIYLYVDYELGFEKHLDNYQNIYRVVTHFNNQGEIAKRPGSRYPLTDVLRTDFPEIEKALHIQYGSNPSLRVKKGDDFSPTRTYNVSYAYVEPDYPEVFAVKWLRGDPETALKDPHTVVLTESFVERLFSDVNQDIMGQQLDFNHGHLLTITGIIKDPVSSSEFDMDMLLSFNSLEGHQESYDAMEWGFSMGTLQAYVVINDKVDLSQTEVRLNQIQEKYIKQDWASDMTFFLQPLSDMHYNAEYQVLQKPAVTKKYVLILAGVGALLVLIAFINYINLSMAFALKNSKKTGIRKAMGCSRANLIWHSIHESGLITIMAMVGGMGLAYWLLNFLKSNVDFEKTINFDFTDPTFLVVIITFFLIGVLAGLYPAVFQIRAKEIDAIKNLSVLGSQRPLRRRMLVIFQFGVAQVLIVMLFVLVKQITFVENRPLGFNKENIVNLPMPQGDNQELESFKNLLSGNSGIENITFAVNPPSDISYWYGEYDYHKDGALTKVSSHVKFVDEQYVSTYDLQLVAGRDFLPSDTLLQLIVNEEFVKKMGLSNPDEAVGEQIAAYGRTPLIVGVVRDFHAQSLHEEIPPVLIMKSRSYLQTAGIRINPNSIAQTLSGVEEAWKQVYPNREFAYSFLSEVVDGFYTQDRNRLMLLKLFAFISIVIACLGIYGLVSFLTAQKVKEIGVRKVLGAKVTNLIMLFSKEFLILVLLALVISSPIAHMTTNNWLENFTYKVDIGIVIFALAGTMSALIALGTVSIQSYKAATANPVNSLRND